MTTRAMLVFVVGCPLLGGCVQGPPLEYTAFREGGGPLQGDYSGLTKFTLARSLILLQAEKDQPISLASVPAEATGGGTDFGIRQLDASGGMGLEVTKVDNTNLVDSVALRGRSARSLVTGQAAPAEPAPAQEVPTKSSIVIDVQALLGAANPSPYAVAGIARSDRSEVAFRLSVSAVPTDAIPTHGLDLRRTGNLYFYSACRSATITFLSPPLTRQAYTVTVADPNFVQTVAIGTGRTLVSHSSCGVDVLAASVAATHSSPDAVSFARQARTLNARWVTRPMVDDASALAALKPAAVPKASRRKQKVVAVPRQPVTGSAAPALPEASPKGPLRNTQIQVPLSRSGQSFAF